MKTKLIPGTNCEVIGPDQATVDAVCNAVKIKTKLHKHDWQTVQSFGAFGHRSKCSICGKVATFISND